MLITTANIETAIEKLIDRGNELTHLRCFVCGKEYKRESGLKKHIEKQHEEELLKVAEEVAKEQNLRTKQEALREINEWITSVDKKQAELRERIIEIFSKHGIGHTTEWYLEGVLKKEQELEEMQLVAKRIEKLKEKHGDPDVWISKIENMLDKMEKRVKEELAYNPIKFNTTNIFHTVIKSIQADAKVNFWLRFRKELEELRWHCRQYLKAFAREILEENGKEK